MQIHLSPRHLTLTPSIHGYVAEKIGHLEDYAPEIIAAHVVLIFDQKASAIKRHRVKVHVAIPGPDLHAEADDKELYAAIDKVWDKLTRLLRKRKTRLVTGQRHRTQQAAEKAKRAVSRTR
ncbi:MAG: ribosome hibernation-promoting factor, HPF/YfiA family [Verrucomicrobiales bacterium]